MNTATSSDIGSRIAQRLAHSVGPRRYALWFDRSARFDYDDDDRTLRVAVPNRFVADWIGRHFSDDLQRAAHEELGESVALDVQVQPDRFARDEAPEADSAPAAAPSRADAGAALALRRPGGLHPSTPSPSPQATSAAGAALPSLRPRRAADRAHRPGEPGTPLACLRHRLESFIVGPSNELAFAAACRLADEVAEPGHPLFIHGGCGLGKTHLLQGICRRMLEHHPAGRVLYTTGEQFTNDYITAVRTNKLDAFRRRIRQLDVLAVDDVHFLADKQATQQEFLHSFDHIELGGARVVLASDCHPKLIRQFSEALVSRCVRGLVVPIKPPDVATRARLIEALAERRGLPLQATVVQTLAQRSTGSVREIEGLLTKLSALVQLARQNGQSVPEPIGHHLVRQLLDAEAAPGPTRPVRFETVLKVVAEELGVPVPQVLGRGRHRLVVLARSLVIHLTRQLTAMSYPEIAQAFGRGNHSTIITAAQRVQKQLDAGETLTLPPQMEPITLAELVDRLRREIARA